MATTNTNPTRTYRSDTYQNLVTEAADLVVDKASELIERGWTVDAALKQAELDELCDFDAYHTHDLFAAFDEYGGRNTEEWPEMDRHGDIRARVNEWMDNGPNPAESAGMAAAIEMVIVDARAEAKARLSAVDPEVQTPRFLERLSEADAVYRQGDYIGIADTDYGIYKFDGIRPRLVRTSAADPFAPAQEALEAFVDDYVAEQE